jgi:hypothetical protein
MEFYWIESQKADNFDEYAAFRGTFFVENDGEIILRVFGASWFSASLDGGYLTEGPYRFDRAHPQYEELTVGVAAGRHVVSAKVHDENIDTRILQKMPPFFGVEILTKDGKNVGLKWKAIGLEPIRPQRRAQRRINPQLAWMESFDVAQLPDFARLDFDDSLWPTPKKVNPGLGALQRVNLNHIRRDEINHKTIGTGSLAENFGYADDDPPARFFLRDLTCMRNPQDGVWYRIDLGKTRLFRFEAQIEASAGTVFEIAYSETLEHGRVNPWITLSCGHSCNLDRYILREGANTFGNLTPHGGRYVEIHIIGDHKNIELKSIQFYDRCYFGKPLGGFRCDDDLLNDIWDMGVETLRSCCEDAVIDNPTRERGEWTGDVIHVGMEICASAYDDLRLIRRGLEQSAWSAGADGCIAGLCPGGIGMLASYALQWTNCCVEYFRQTGDRTLLVEFLPYAKNNLGYFKNRMTKHGVSRDTYWTFIDWGYVTNEGESDMGLNLHLHSALRAFLTWCDMIGNTTDKKEAEAFLVDIKKVINRYLAAQKGNWERIGMHRAILALGEGFFEGAEIGECIDFVKSHYIRCFPNDPDAPRLSAPDRDHPQLITPYFSHYVFPILWEHGEGDFVVNQYRSCWGWLAAQDATFLEVFDDRWTHCHQWSGCPTWQLSRYVLGLMPRFDIKKNCYDFSRLPCQIKNARGTYPINGGGKIDIVCTSEFTELVSDTDAVIRKDGKEYALNAGKKLAIGV